MKKLFEKHFERTWLIIFLIMFLIIIILILQRYKKLRLKNTALCQALECGQDVRLDNVLYVGWQILKMRRVGCTIF